MLFKIQNLLRIIPFKKHGLKLHANPLDSQHAISNLYTKMLVSRKPDDPLGLL